MPIIKPFQGHEPRIHPTAFIAETAVLIGDVTVEAGASIWYGCVLRGDVAPIFIGQGSNVQDGTVIHVASATLNGRALGTHVGRGCTVGHMALLHACTLEDEAFVGMKACVMDAATIVTHSMLGAGSLLPPNKRTVEGSIWMGSPAKQHRWLTTEERCFLTQSATWYEQLSRLSMI